MLQAEPNLQTARTNSDEIVNARRNQQIVDGLQAAEAKRKNGDNAGAVEAYNEVLRLDPANQTARENKQEVLKECRILGVPCATNR